MGPTGRPQLILLILLIFLLILILIFLLLQEDNQGHAHGSLGTPTSHLPVPYLPYLEASRTELPNLGTSNLGPSPDDTVVVAGASEVIDDIRDTIVSDGKDEKTAA